MWTRNPKCQKGALPEIHIAVGQKFATNRGTKGNKGVGIVPSRITCGSGHFFCSDMLGNAMPVVQAPGINYINIAAIVAIFWEFDLRVLGFGLKV